MARPRLLDLFCGAGGAAFGYHFAGFDVLGVDINPQPRYPYPFVQADALDYLADHGREFQAVHASPPCQRYSAATKSTKGLAASHPDSVPPTRSLLREVGVPYVIENVEGAPMLNPVRLCGSMFGLLVQRHRLFETSFPCAAPSGCRHERFAGNFPTGRSVVSGRSHERSRVVAVYGHTSFRGGLALWQRAMGIDWMTMKELAQAIPPAYTVWIGTQFINHL